MQHNIKQQKICYHYHRKCIELEDAVQENLPVEEFSFSQLFVEFPPQEKTDAWYAVKCSDLILYNKDICMCKVCKKIFSADKIEQMEKLFSRLNELAEIDNTYLTPLTDTKFLNLCSGLEPVKYHTLDDGIVEITETVHDPRKWDVYHPEWWRNVREYETVYPVCKLPDRKHSRNYCSHYHGLPFCILRNEDAEKHSGENLPRLVGGDAESYLFINDFGECKCKNCKKVFSQKQKVQMKDLINYLNTPHFATDDDKANYEEWRGILEHYDVGYAKENQPFEVLDIEKVLELIKGIEPVLYKGYEGKRGIKILSDLKWKNGKWTV